MGFGAKLYCPKFTNHGDLLHLGTREIQLVLLKTALLFGVRLLTRTELVAVQAPARASADGSPAPKWAAWARSEAFAAIGAGVAEEGDETTDFDSDEETDDDDDGGGDGDDGGDGGDGDGGDGDGDGDGDGEGEGEDQAKGNADDTNGGGAGLTSIAEGIRAVFGNRPEELSTPPPPPPPVVMRVTKRSDGDAKAKRKAKGSKKSKGARAGARGGSPKGSRGGSPAGTRGGKPEGSAGAHGSQSADDAAVSAREHPQRGPRFACLPSPASLATLSLPRLSYQALLVPPPLVARLRSHASLATPPFTPPAVRVQLSAALDFKPLKTGDYVRHTLQGKNNALATSEVSHDFVVDEERPVPLGVRRVGFDTLVIAEGEWSPTCKQLGVTKTIDRFATAIGIVVNLVLDPDDPACKSLKSFVQQAGRTQVAGGRTLGHELNWLKEHGVECENLEYLKGETHYIAACVKKVALFACGILKEDLPAAQASPPLPSLSLSPSPAAQASPPLPSLSLSPSPLPRSPSLAPSLLLCHSPTPTLASYSGILLGRPTLVSCSYSYSDGSSVSLHGAGPVACSC